VSVAVLNQLLFVAVFFFFSFLLFWLFSEPEKKKKKKTRPFFSERKNSGRKEKKKNFFLLQKALSEDRLNHKHLKKKKTTKKFTEKKKKTKEGKKKKKRKKKKKKKKKKNQDPQEDEKEKKRRKAKHDPVPRANPFPEVTDLICRLPLLTLFWSARGCSPWRPDADIGTVEPRGPIDFPDPSDFQGPTEALRTATGKKTRAALVVVRPVRRSTRFRGRSGRGGRGGGPPLLPPREKTINKKRKLCSERRSTSRRCGLASPLTSCEPLGSVPEC